MIDVNRQLRILIKSGKVEFGAKRALEAAKTGKAKMIILASNCPEKFKTEILYCAKLSKIPVYAHKASSVDLGPLCDKPFPVSAITVKDPGDSEILKLAEE